MPSVGYPDEPGNRPHRVGRPVPAIRHAFCRAESDWPSHRVRLVSMGPVFVTKSLNASGVSSPHRLWDRAERLNRMDRVYRSPTRASGLGRRHSAGSIRRAASCANPLFAGRGQRAAARGSGRGLRFHDRGAAYGLTLGGVASSLARKDCGVEQLAARRAHNPEVAGSSPAPASAPVAAKTPDRAVIHPRPSRDARAFAFLTRVLARA